MIETPETYLRKMGILGKLDDIMDHIERLAKMRNDAASQDVDMEMFYIRELLRDIIEIIKLQS